MWMVLDCYHPISSANRARITLPSLYSTGLDGLVARSYTANEIDIQELLMQDVMGNLKDLKERILSMLERL